MILLASVKWGKLREIKQQFQNIKPASCSKKRKIPGTTNKEYIIGITALKITSNETYEGRTSHTDTSFRALLFCIYGSNNICSIYDDEPWPAINITK